MYTLTILTVLLLLLLLFGINPRIRFSFRFNQDLLAYAGVGIVYFALAAYLTMAGLLIYIQITK